MLTASSRDSRVVWAPPFHRPIGYANNDSTGSTSLAAGRASADVVTLHDQERAGRRNEAAGTAVVDDGQRPRPLARKLRTHQHGQRKLRRERHARQSLDGHRRTDRAELGNLRDIEVLTLLQFLVELMPRQGEAAKLGGLGLELHGELVDGLGQRTLIGGEPEIHQRGSRGSLSRSVAIRLS